MPVATIETVQIIQMVLTFLTTLALPFIAYFIRKLEKNTNSIKDALVVSTEKEALARGKLQGRAAEKAENGTLT